ncbi:MAG TPA: ABC transporter permease [Pyrinomonadaceae bacterium]
MNNLWHDIKYGVRTFLKSPAFTIIAILTLAFGIGINTAIFSVVNAVLLRPLPYEAPERLMLVGEINPHASINQVSIAPANFADYRDQSKSFQSLGLYRITARSGFNLAGDGPPERVIGATVSANLFPTLGVSPELGRTFVPEEEVQGSNNSVILSHSLWERRFGSDKDILNKTLNLNGVNYKVVGVMPKGFNFPSKDVMPNGGAGLTKPMDLWVPLALGPRDWQARGSRYLFAVGRLKPGVSVEQAQSELTLVANGLQQQHVQVKDWFAKVIPMQEQAVGSIKLALLVLFGAVGFVLLIACANVANLLLARAASRKKEMAVRVALGANRARVIRQLLTESMLLALCGGLLGLLLALWGVQLLISLAPSSIPLSAGVGLDSRVVIFTLGISFLTAVLFGLAPAFQASKVNLTETLKAGGRTTSGEGGQKLRSLLVVSEIALAGLLMIGAALLLRSFVRLNNVNPGFDASNILTFQISLPLAQYMDDPKSSNFYRQLKERVKSLPGVQSVSGTTSLPMSSGSDYTSFTVVGRPPLPPGEFLFAEHIALFPDYFRTMRIPLLKGREFTPQDGHESTPVAVINEAMAKRYFPEEDPIGKRILIDYDQGVAREIVGVTSNVRHFGLDAEPKPEMYVPQYQYESLASYLTVRTANDPTALASAVGQAARDVDKDVPVYNVTTMEQTISTSLARQKFSTLLMSIFAGIATLLACIGLYGVIAYSVHQRHTELGIRIALGAQSRDILGLIVGQGFKLALIGIAIGLIGAFIMTRLIASLLYDVSATDPATFIGIALLLGFVALLSSFLPARRATQVDPIVTLRSE